MSCCHTALPAASQLHGGVGTHQLAPPQHRQAALVLSWDTSRWRARTMVCKLKNKGVFILRLFCQNHYQKWPESKNSTIGLWNRTIQIGKQRQSRKAFWAQDKRAFQAGNCQHCLHPLIWDNYFFLSSFAPLFQKGLPYGFSNGRDVFFDDCFFE